jgi:hypothetical protein
MTNKTVHRCGPMPTERRRRILHLESMIAAWMCGDYDGTSYKAKGDGELELLIEARNQEVAHLRSIGHCERCGYPW